MRKRQWGIVGCLVLLWAISLGAAQSWAVGCSPVVDATSLATAITEADARNCPTITFAVSGPDATVTVSGTLPPITHDVTIDGSNGGVPLVITTTGTTGIFSVTGGNVTFENLQIEGDTTTPHDQAVDGGAIRVDESDAADTVTIEHSTFEADTEAAGHSGGAVADVGAGAIDVHDSSFTDDAATGGAGGAIYVDTSAVGLSDVTGSTFEADAAGEGGAIDISGVNGDGVAIERSTFEDDASSGDGGAINSAGPVASEALITQGVFIGNTAASDGGAIAVGASGSDGVLTTDWSLFSGNEATNGHGGAIYDGTDNGVLDSYVVHSTFVGDKLGSANAADGYAIFTAGTQLFDVTANLFVESCAGTLTSTGYNVSMPAGDGGSSCAGGATGDQVSTLAGAVAPSAQNAQLLTPVSPNPALDLIPANTTAVIGTTTTPICPTPDLLDNQGPDATGRCNAGALQNPASSSSTGAGASGGGSGAATSTNPPVTTTVPPPAPAPATPKTVTTRVRVDNQQITLVSPSMNVCAAAGGTLSATLSSTAIKHSRKPKLKFALATFLAGGKDKRTARHLTARVSIKLKGLKAASTDKLKVRVRYREPRRHHKPRTVSRTISVKFKVC